LLSDNYLDTAENFPRTDYRETVTGFKAIGELHFNQEVCQDWHFTVTKLPPEAPNQAV
jgi:hypothetical protein